VENKVVLDFCCEQEELQRERERERERERARESQREREKFIDNQEVSESR